MSTTLGKSRLASLGEYRVRGWFTRALVDLVEKIISATQYKNEIISGGVITAPGTISASVVQVTTTALSCFLKGRLMAAIAAQTTQDLFTTAGVFGKATYTSGADASAISLATDEVVYVTIIACNTDGAGGAVEDDNGAAKLVAIVNGTATTRGSKTGPATSAEIQAALEASTNVHDGVTGWVHVCSFVWDENTGSPTAVITMNRNNVVSAV